MHALRTAISLSAASLLLPLAVASPAAGEPRWTEAQQLGRSGSVVDIAVDQLGNAVAVWAGDGKVMAAYREAGSPWGAPELIQRNAFTANAFIDGQGDATAVWLRDGVWHVSDRLPDGRWKVDTSAALSERRGTCVDEAAMGNDLAGNLVLTWTETDCEGYFSWSRTVWRFADGSWGSVRDDQGGLPVAALTVDDGVATLVGQTAGLGVWTQTSTMGGPLAEREVLFDADSVPDIASNTRGDIVVGATDGLGGPGNAASRLVTRTKPVGEDWQAVQASPWGDGSASAASVAVGEDRTTAAAFTRRRSETMEVLAVSGAVGAASWTAPADVSGELTSSPMVPDVAVAPDGSSVASWAGSSDSYRVTMAHVSRRVAGGDWGPFVRLGHAFAQPPRVVAHPNGRITAAWSDGSPLSSDYLEDLTEPSAHLTAPQRDFAADTNVRVAWRAADDLAGVWNTTVRVRSARRGEDFSAWSMWQRNTPRTEAVFAGKPGRTYCFSVRASDRAGNVGNWSAERCTTTPIDDRAFEARRPWSRAESSSAYQRTLTTATTGGARLRLENVTARTLRLVVRTCPRCGKVRVSHGGRELGVVDLSSARARNRQVVLLRRYTAIRGGAVVVRVVSPGKPVSIDGIIASR